MSQTYLKNVAIVGAGGQVGGFIAGALIKQGMHNVTAITRLESASVMPAGIHAIKKADYNDHASIVGALAGQEALVITIKATVPKGTQEKIIDAACEAGVKYIIPNEYSSDHEKKNLSRDILLGPRQEEVRRYIESKGGSRTAWVGISCSFWYEYSLAAGEWCFGFDFAQKKLTLFDDGRTVISTSTWPQTGLTVARLLALPLTSMGGGPNLDQFANKAVYVSSFAVSQRDMLASVLRVTGDRESDWTITREDSHDRYTRGTEMFGKGEMVGFGLLLYSRIFFPEDPGNHQAKLDNDVLGLPEEDLDEATKAAVERAKRTV